MVFIDSPLAENPPADYRYAFRWSPQLSVNANLSLSHFDLVVLLTLSNTGERHHREKQRLGGIVALLPC